MIEAERADPPALHAESMSSAARVRGRSPRTVVRLELLRAATDMALAPLRFVPYLFRLRGLRRELGRDLAHPAEVEDIAGTLELPDRPLSILISSAEPSGEAHALNLVQALRSEVAAAGGPPPILHGLGSERLARLDVETLADPLAHAAMGTDVLRSLPYYKRLLEKVGTFLRDERPDVFVPVDSPALHVPLARMAREYGVPTVHFVAPQYWAWAPWRIAGYRRAVDLALTILPFERAWFERRGMHTAHVGHPQLDVLAARTQATKDNQQRRTLVILPGSRRSVIERNFVWMLGCADRTRALLVAEGQVEPELVVAHDDAGQEALLHSLVESSGIGGRVRFALGDLHKSLAEARVALSVSGTILLDLLRHRLPTAVVYRLSSRLLARYAQDLISAPWFASVNLLAEGEVLPEASFHGEGPREEFARYLARAFADAEFRADVQRALDEAVQRLGPPGATRRAARHALALATRGGER